jgi:small subunit ribosomal protein S21
MTIEPPPSAVDTSRPFCYTPAPNAAASGDKRMAASKIHPSIGDERVQILVRDNNVEQALRVLKKKMQREGIFREMKLRGHYEKPSERKAREKAEAVRRARKLARKRAQREGLVPMKPKPVVAGTPTRAPRRDRAVG